MQQTNGAARRAATRSRSSNPATGELIAEVPNHERRRASAAAAIRGRRAQPAWEAAGYATRGGRDVRAALLGDPEPRADPRRDRGRERQDPRGRHAGGDLVPLRLARLLGQERREVPRRRARPYPLATVARQEGHRPLPAPRAGRRDRAVELPAHERLRRLPARPDGRLLRAPEAERGDAAGDDADGGGPARGGPARGRAADPHRRRRHRPSGDRQRRHDHVHRVHRHR